MRNMKSKQRYILISYSGETTCERVLYVLVKLFLEDRGGRMDRGNEHGES